MSKLKNFYNKILNDNRIFTAEDVGEMSKHEFSANEKAIDYQMSHLGIPRNSDLVDNPDAIYVHAYTKDDGTKVKAHYRSKADGVISNNFQSDEKLTGAAADMDNHLTLKGGVSYTNTLRDTIDGYSSDMERSIVGAGIYISLAAGVNTVGRLKHQDDAVELWNIASNPIGVYANKYIKNNGKLYKNTKEINSLYPQYKEHIKSKISSQFGVEDAPGIVFHEYSSLAKNINKSQEIKDFIDKNYYDLKNGKEIKYSSIAFEKDGNLKNALGKTEVLSAKEHNGYVDLVLLDTYDFNKNEQDWKVQMGYNVQSAGLLNPYFSVIKCRYKI